MTRRTEMRDLADRVYDALVDSVPAKDYARLWACLHRCATMMEIMCQQLEDPPSKAYRLSTAKDARVYLEVLQGHMRDRSWSGPGRDDE